MRFRPLTNCVWMSLLLLVAIAIPVHAQVAIEDLGYHQEKPLEPGDATVMLDSADTVDGQAALGEGFIVFKFKLTDIDPIADDASDVRVTCILIENLGTATGGGSTTTGSVIVQDDILQVMVMDQDSNSFAAPLAPQTTGGGTGNCNTNVLQRTNNPGNAQIAWEAFFAPTTNFIIPDDGSEEFQVAVRTNTTDLLDDDSQGHTLLLRATVQTEEIVGSPPRPSLFVERVTDSSAETIWNGGINSFTEDTYAIDPLMPGETGVVSRFTICDYDANEHQLIINRFFLKQDEDGTALSSDINSFDLYRVEGFTRTLVASRTPDSDFDRSSGAKGGMPLPGFNGTFTDPVSDPRFALTIPDDTCMTFELEAQISAFAFKGHTIKPRIQISSEEPRSTPIDNTVQPEIITNVSTLIGKGLISIPDVDLIGKPGIVPVNVEGVQLPGLSTIQVGPVGKLQYNPNVIQLKSITGVDPYVVDAVEIDNRRGEARFTVRLDPLRGNPFLTATQKGTVANIRIEPMGTPGRSSRWVLTYDCVELVAQPTCMPQGFPFPGTPNQHPGNDISVAAGKVTLVFPGDIDLDGKPTVSDAVQLATAILPCSRGESLPSPGGVQTPSNTQFGFPTTPLNKIPSKVLDDEQRSIADVAAPFASENQIPDCLELTSADVAEIARLAINFGTEPAPKAFSSGMATVASANQDRPWYGFLNDFWGWMTGRSDGSSQSQVALNFNAEAQALNVVVDGAPGVTLGGLQGRLYFDPATARVQGIQGANGYEVVAYKVDNTLGEVRFIALAPNGPGNHAGPVLALNVEAQDGAFEPTLAVEFLVDERGEDVPFAITRSQGFLASPVSLSLHGVQALAQTNGSYQFRAQGTGITGLSVQVFDLGGVTVFDREAAGQALVFQPLSQAGQPLANGVYLYVVTAKGYHGQTIRSAVKKLVILR